MLRIANFQLNVKYVYNSPIVPCYFASKRDFATDGLVLMAHRHTHFSCLSLCAQVTITDYMLSFLLSSKENRIHKGQYVTKSFWLSQASNTLLINMNVKLHSSIDLTAKTYQKKYYLTIDQHVTVFQACVILLMSVF